MDYIHLHPNRVSSLMWNVAVRLVKVAPKRKLVADCARRAVCAKKIVEIMYCGNSEIPPSRHTSIFQSLPVALFIVSGQTETQKGFVISSFLESYFSAIQNQPRPSLPKVIIFSFEPSRLLAFHLIQSNFLASAYVIKFHLLNIQSILQSSHRKFQNEYTHPQL